MKNRRVFVVVIPTFILLLVLSFMPVTENHSAALDASDLLRLHQPFFPPPVDSVQYFPTQVDCKGCHGKDPDGFAMVDSDGQDVSMHEDWVTSMMGMSAKDPFWRAKVSHEVAVNPMHSAELQDKCTSCHAPMGHYTSKYEGHEHYLIADLLTDTVGLDGVSCGACHQMSPENLGNLFSGEIIYDTTRVQYGPYENPFAPPMANFVGFTPIASEHINDAGICASCHSLVTKSVDLDGNFTGTTFVEQATYHEWLNSQYNTDDVSCQSCHMPRIEDSVIISDNYLFLEERYPYALHDLVGANTFMIQLMKDNKEALEVDAPDENFDETLAKTLEMLQLNTLDMSLELINLDPDTAYFEIALTNKAGHKFPSGYPSRRAFIEFVALSEEGDTLFQSGVIDDTYEVIGQDEQFEPHYDVINQTEQVQIYEFVIGDVNSNFSSVLEQGYVPLKDNRLPPLGFSTEHEVYDTTAIVGNALFDADFNKDENGNQGTGGDIIRYHVALNGYTGLVDIRARVWYQSLPPKWMAAMFATSTPEIESFKAMYDAADQSPVLISAAAINDLFVESVSVEEVSPSMLGLSPNPTRTGTVFINGSTTISSIRIFNLQGQLLSIIDAPGEHFSLPQPKGLYIVQLETDQGSQSVKLLRQ